MGQVFLNTNASAAGGVLGAMAAARLITGKVDVTMAINGAIAGLVSISCIDTPTGGLATLIGAIGGVIVFFSVTYLDKIFKIDDPVILSAHGVVGIWGIVAVCPLQMLPCQLNHRSFNYLCMDFCSQWFSLYALDKVVGIRASESDEIAGLDQAEIGVESTRMPNNHYS